MGAFVAEIMLISVIICRSRSVSGSVIPAVLLHSVHNLVDQVYLQPLSTRPGVSFLAGEQGLITIFFTAVIVVFVVFRWSNMKKKSIVEGAFEAFSGSDDRPDTPG